MRVKHGSLSTIMLRSMGARVDFGTGVTGRGVGQIFPDSFMADPIRVAQPDCRLLGYDSDASELFEITVAVLGYHNRDMGDFINPRAAGWWLAGLYCRR